jgi:CSLREA domain-containing protein
MPRILPLARALILLAFLAVPFASPEATEAATLTVNTTDDTSDGVCTASHCSLREAVNAANLTPGPDSISFNIPGAGPHVIRLTSGLTLSQPSTIIAGDTEPDFTGQPVIVLDGRDVTHDGLSLVGDYSVVRALSLVNFDGSGSAAIMVGGHHSRVENCWLGIDTSGTPGGNAIGIELSGEDQVLTDSTVLANQVGVLLSNARRTVVQRNRIGLAPSGAIVGNETGIRLQRGTQDVLIGGDSRDQKNVIVGSAQYGIHDTSTPYGGNVIDNNFIGTSGLESAPNGVGVYRFGEGGISVDGDLTIRRSVIAGNATGLWLNGSHHVVEDNFIGIDSLFHPMPNTEVGVRLEGCADCIVDGNVISGNPVGILFSAGPGIEFDTVISHNRVGVDPGISYVIPNGIGIQIEGGQRTVIEGNTIGGNDYGLQLNGGSATVTGNFVGYMGFGEALPNTVGVRIGVGFAASTIGGSSEADGNIIAFNRGDGLLSLAGGQVIWHNQIFSNAGHGVHIDAGMAEVRPGGLGDVISHNSIYGNDGLGIRVEAPELVGGLEPPVLTAASTTSVSGTTAPNSLVEVFLAEPDPTRHGEGKTYLGERSVDSDGAFTITFADAGACPVYTATATDGRGNTSEFSLNRSTCLHLPPLLGIGILVGLAGGGSAFTLIIRRQPPNLRALPWALLGGLAGVGLGLLFLSLPSVRINWEQDGQPATPVAVNLPPPMILTPVVDITVTPAPEPELMARENANCRHGPSMQFNVATYLLQGQVVPITGRLAEGGWWQVQAPDLEAPCWVSENVAEPNGDLDAAPLVAPPAPPTITPTEEPASGCRCWTGNVCQALPQCPAQCTPCP